jgi:DNA-binding CsgD family transcriptional regulator
MSGGTSGVDEQRRPIRLDRHIGSGALGFDVAARTQSRNPECRGLVEQGRRACAGRSWEAAYAAFSQADRETPLAADELEVFAMSAYMLGRDEAYLMTLERAHQAHVDAAAHLRAARCAFWIGLRQSFRGETAQANGWFQRAGRLIACEDCAERGYLLLAVAEPHLAADEHDAAYAVATEAAAIGDRFGEPDLTAIARHQQGRARVGQGRLQEGLALLDEVMVAVTANELSPPAAGLMYCAVIECCQLVRALERAREWTAAFSRWCEAQPEMLAFTGICRLHRAELLEFGGRWSDAADEAQRVIALSLGARAAAAALYRLAEVHRLRGELALAEQTYKKACDAGFDPQPGLALLLLARGDIDAAAQAARRVLITTTDRLRRAQVLPACIEILLAKGELEEPREACSELEEIAASLAMDTLHAAAAHARGAVRLAEGDARGALPYLHRAAELWHRVGSPYALARARVLLGQACRDFGDRTGAELELAAARTVFERLGATLDTKALKASSEGQRPRPPHGLTERELEVLRFVAAGKTNKSIAAALCLSEKTIERHVSNVFAKLGVPSRAAATAYAYAHQML